MKFWEKYREAIFVYQGMKPINSTKSIDIILSPEFYWIKKKSLPIKFSFEAKKYAPSLFEGFLPKGEYKYLISKEDNEFLFIAYDESFITQFLESIGIKIEYISKIYFTQSEKEFFQNPIYLDNNRALISIDSVATILNRDLIADNITLYNQNREYKPSGVYATITKNTLLTQKQIYIFIFLISLFAIINFIEAFEYRFKKEKIKNNFEEFISKTNLPISSYELKSIYNKYNKIDSIERKKREITSNLIKTITQNRGEITLFELDKRDIFIKVKGDKRLKAKLLKNRFVERVRDEKDFLMIKANVK